MADRELLTTNEVAQMCGVTPQTIRTWIERGRLPKLRIGGQYRIPADEAEALVAGLRNQDLAADGAGTWEGEVSELPRVDNGREHGRGAGEDQAAASTWEGTHIDLPLVDRRGAAGS